MRQWLGGQPQSLGALSPKSSSGFPSNIRRAASLRRRCALPLEYGCVLKRTPPLLLFRTYLPPWDGYFCTGVMLPAVTL